MSQIFLLCTRSQTVKNEEMIQSEPSTCVSPEHLMLSAFRKALALTPHLQYGVRAPSDGITHKSWEWATYIILTNTWQYIYHTPGNRTFQLRSPQDVATPVYDPSRTRTTQNTRAPMVWSSHAIGWRHCSAMELPSVCEYVGEQDCDCEALLAF